MDEATFVIHLRQSRLKAKDIAIAEILALTRDLGAVRSIGGPLSEVRGTAWINLPERNVMTACSRLHNLGYTEAVDLVRSLSSIEGGQIKIVTKWKRRDVALMRIYEEPESLLREDAPDRRTFLIESKNGTVRPIKGYRGGSKVFEHRALPVVDARLLVNLVWQPNHGVFLDPFAGAGGIVIAAKTAKWETISIDIDPSLRFGLKQISDSHIVGDATMLPFERASIDGIATEPPYHSDLLDIVIGSVHQMVRVLQHHGRLAMLVAAHQVEPIRHTLHDTGLTLEIDAPIDRKGTPVHCFVCRR